MRIRNLLTTILLLSAGATLLAVPGSANSPNHWGDAGNLTARELFFAASNPGDGYLEYRQALAVAGMAFDLGVHGSNLKADLGEVMACPFWPMDRDDQLWAMIPDDAEFENLPAGSFVTLGESTGMGLSEPGIGLETWRLREWYAEGEWPGTSQLAAVPSMVWQARALLRPAQSWELVDGDPKAGMREIYEDLQLAPNPHVLGGLQQSFDRVEFFYGNDSDQSRAYLLLLTLGDQAWLWSAGEPTLGEPGFDMRLVVNAQALDMTKGNEGRKPRSMGTLDDLGKLVDAPMRLAWLLESEAVSRDHQRKAWENRARLTLRALGSSQLAYQDQNLAKNYGSWDNMIEPDYIQRGYSRGNMIDNYSLAVFFADNSASSKARNHFSNSDASFTVVAVPLNQRNKLRTFSICDDQTVRVATNFHLNIVPNHGNSVPIGDDPCSWDPLR